MERPANPEHGDAATNLAMKLARPYRRPPLEIARAIAAELEREVSERPAGTPAGSVSVAPPGFINVRYADRALAAIVESVLAEPAVWGRIPPAAPRSVNVEFVSANPTGPLTIGNARGAFVGDLLCRVLEAGVGAPICCGVENMSRWYAMSGVTARTPSILRATAACPVHLHRERVQDDLVRALHVSAGQPLREPLRETRLHAARCRRMRGCAPTLRPAWTHPWTTPRSRGA